MERWWPAKCPECDWSGLSRDCDGGTAIADTGDYSDVICPEYAKNEKDATIIDDGN